MNGANTAAVWAAVPLKAPRASKTRLAPFLSPVQRRQLYFAMARRVIGALLCVPRIERVLAVTAHAEVAGFATRLGAQLVPQADDRGTSAAFEAAIEVARAAGAPRLLMIAGDLPQITPRALNRLLDLAPPERGVVIVPDRRGRGTNALLCTPVAALTPRFGPDSCARHRAAAATAGLACTLHHCESLGLDLDDRDDLNLLLAADEPAGPARLAEAAVARILAPFEETLHVAA